MPAALIPTAISAGTSILGGLLGSSASSKAAKIQSQTATTVANMSQAAADKGAAGVNAATGAATTGVTDATKAGQEGISAAVPQAIGQVQGAANTANTTLGNLFQQQTTNLNPYQQAGVAGVGSLQDLLASGALTQKFNAPSGADVSSTPEYQFQMQEGMKALQRSAAATGGMQSGGTLKAITQYGQGLASTSYQNAYNNALNTFNTNRQGTLAQMSGLQGLVNTGQTANSQFNQAAQQYGGQASSNTMSAGMFGGNTTMQGATTIGQMGMQGATTAGQFGLQGATTAGQMGLQGAQLAGQALTGGANAQAAGTMGSANAWSNAIGGVGNASMNGYYGNKIFGGGTMGTMPNYAAMNPSIASSGPDFAPFAAIAPVG